MGDAVGRAVELLHSAVQADSSSPLSTSAANGLAAQLAPALTPGSTLASPPLWATLAGTEGASEETRVAAAEEAWPARGRNAAPANTRIASFAAELMAYAAAHPMPSALAAGSEAKAVDAAYLAWAQVYARAALVFQQPEVVWFAPTLVHCGRALLFLARRADAASPAAVQARTTDAASRLSKSVGVSSNDRSAVPCLESKRAAVLPLAVLSFKAYFALDNLRLCSTVLGSVDNALKSNKEHDPTAVTGEESYSLADRVAYHYYIGRLRVGQQALRAAYTELRWSFDHAPYAPPGTSPSADHNLRLIAIPLLTAALVQGIFPSPELYSLPALAPLASVFYPLQTAVQQGNGARMLQLLQAPRRKTFFHRHQLYLLLHENLPLLTWRCLVRRAALLYRHSQPVSNGPPTLPIKLLTALAQVSWGEPFTELEVEALVISLIGQGFLKAYVSHSRGLVVFQKGPKMGFEAVRKHVQRLTRYPISWTWRPEFGSL